MTKMRAVPLGHILDAPEKLAVLAWRRMHSGSWCQWALFVHQGKVCCMNRDSQLAQQVEQNAPLSFVGIYTEAVKVDQLLDDIQATQKDYT